MGLRIRAASRNGLPPSDEAAYVGAEHLSSEATTSRYVFYAAIRELAARYERERPSEAARPALESVPLTGAEFKVFSQNGEDGVIAELLRRIGTGPRFFAEIGTGSGSESNCVALADVLGWGGVFFECDPRLNAQLEAKYAGRARVRTVQAVVTPENVGQLLADAGVPTDLDILAIDTDGRDYWLWNALTGFAPRIVVIEYNAALGPSEALTVPSDHTAPWDGTQFFGASIAALQQLASARGSRLVHTDLSGTNAFFVRSDLLAGCPAADVVPIHRPNYLLTGLGHRPARAEQEFVVPPEPDR
jgi:hypothetical protein